MRHQFTSHSGPSKECPMARRKFIKGLYVPGIDGPTETPLRLATDRKAEIERQATWHEGNRLNSVAEELALVAVMRKQQVLMGTEKISVIAAQRQFRKGTHVDETQAAHCLPGQLYLNSLPIYDLHGEQERLIKRRGIRPLPLFSKLTHLHGRTDVVNIALNSVDSLVEDMAGGRGLTVLLERSIYRLFERYRFEKSGGWDADFERVRMTVDVIGSPQVTHVKKDFVEMIGPSRFAGAARDALPRVRRCTSRRFFLLLLRTTLALSELRLFPISFSCF